MAIRCAAGVAAVGGLLCVGALRLPLLTPASVLWILCGSMITLGLYQNRRPAAWMDMRIGARIGVVVGLCLTAAVAIPVATAGVLARFWLKAMGSFDAQMAAQFQQVMQRSGTGDALSPRDAGDAAIPGVPRRLCAVLVRVRCGAVACRVRGRRSVWRASAGTPAGCSLGPDSAAADTCIR